MLHPEMASITVRVIPRSSRTSVENDPRGGVVIRVHSAPEGGHATREAARALAAAAGVSPSAVTLRSGARSRTKVFDVEGVSSEDIRIRFHTL
jgi:uncharacterized protein